MMMTPNFAFWLTMFVVTFAVGWNFTKRIALPFVRGSYHAERFASVVVVGMLGSVIAIGIILLSWGLVYFTGAAEKYAIWSPSKVIQKAMPIKNG